MPTLLEDRRDFRHHLLSWLKFWILHAATRTWRWLRPIVLRVVVWIVSIYRLRRSSVVFIGVTGSCGKTTTKEMVAAVLSSQYKGHKSWDTYNHLREVIRSILLTRQDYKF